jgi:hypothetical protein
MKRKINITFEAEIILGNPQMDCERFGICKIIQDENPLLKTKMYKRTAATCTYFAETNLLSIRFWKISLSTATWKYYFNNETFIIEKNCTPRLLIDNKLGLPTTLTILQGKYPIRLVADQYLCVDFETITEKELFENPAEQIKKINQHLFAYG